MFYLNICLVCNMFYTSWDRGNTKPGKKHTRLEHSTSKQVHW